MTTPRQNLSIVRGDDWSHTATFTLQAGTLAGCKLWLTVKASANQPDSEAAVQIDSDGHGVEILDGTTARFSITSAQSALLVPGRQYVFDVQVKTPAGKIYTALRGGFAVEADITLATA